MSSQDAMSSQDEEPLLRDEEERQERSEEKPRSYLKDQIVSCLVLVLYFAASITSVPLLSQYIHSRYAEVYSNTTNTSSFDTQQTSCRAQNTSKGADIIQMRIQQATSLEILKLTLCLSIPPGIINMVIGSYSDILGRKLPLLLPLLGSISKFIVISLVVRLHLPLDFLLLAVLLEGCSGGSSTFILVSLAYAADVTPTHKHRTLAILIRDCSVSIAIACGQLITGVLIDKLGYFYPCITSISLLACATVMVIFGLSETVKERKKHSLSPLVHMKKVFVFYIDKDINRNRGLFIVCLFIFSLISVAMNGKYAVETLYQLGQPFCWDSLTIGYWGAMSTVILSVSGLVVIRASCVKAEVLTVAGLLLGAGSLTLEGMATDDIMMYAVPAVASISSISNSVIRSIMSRKTGPEQQGALFSSLATVDTLCGALGGAAFSALYSATVGTMRGLVFLVSAGLLVIASLVHTITVVKFRLHPEYALVSTPEAEVRADRSTVQNIDT